MRTAKNKAVGSLRPTRRDFLIGSSAVASLRAGTTDGQAVRLRSIPGDGIQPQVAVAQNRIHLVYFSGDPKHGDIFYVKSNDFGRTFSAPLRVNSQQGNALAIGAIRGAQVAVGNDHRVHVAWNGSDLAEPARVINPDSGKPGAPMLYARLNDRGTAFEPQRNLMWKTFGLDGGGSIAADGNGNVYVAWHGKTPGAAEGEAGRQVWIAQSADEGAHFAQERPASSAPTGACGCCGLRIFADSQGILYGLYRSATQNVHRDIYLLRSPDRGRSFSVDLLHPWNVNACPMSSMAFTEAGGEVLAAWETQAQVYFAPVGHGIDAAKRETIAPAGANPKRKYPALARNRRGETLMAWIEGAGWERSGTLGWEVLDPSGQPIDTSRSRTAAPVWSFPAVFVGPDEGFSILV